MGESSHDRLDHFLDGYDLTPAVRKVVRKRVYSANLTPDDPMAMLIAQDAIIESRLEKVVVQVEYFPIQIERTKDSLSAAISKTVTKDIDARNIDFLISLRKEINADIDHAIKTSVTKADIRFFQRAALSIAVVCVLSASMAGLLSYAVARQDVHDLDRQYAQIIARPDARTWLDIISSNHNIDSVLLQQCFNNGPRNMPQDSGREACAVPLFIDAEKALYQTGIAAHFAAMPTWVPSKIGGLTIAGLSVLIGLLFGISATMTFQRRKAN